MCSHLFWILLVGSIPEVAHESLFTCEARFSSPFLQESQNSCRLNKNELLEYTGGLSDILAVISHRIPF